MVVGTFDRLNGEVDWLLIADPLVKTMRVLHVFTLCVLSNGATYEWTDRRQLWLSILLDDKEILDLSPISSCFDTTFHN